MNCTMKLEEKNQGGTDNDRTLPIYRKNGRTLGLLFQDITVHGIAAGATRAPDLFQILQDILITWPTNLAKTISRPKGSIHPTRCLIHEVSGVVPPGETLLVLGRPGAGCSTLLNVLANQRAPFVNVEGHVQYGALSAAEMLKRYGSEFVFNGEDDIHFPTLKVKNTLEFALRLRKPEQNHQSNSEFVHQWTDIILSSLGILHTKDTIVGNAYVRGVSGGERKRVSLAEVLSAAPALVCWDNPLRGLDSSSALGFCQLLKAMSRATGMVNIVTAYQVSESIYQQCFDRVLVLYEGHMIYCGPAGHHPKRYFTEEAGFECLPRQTTPDFLTAITSPEERRVKPGHVPPPPLSPSELAKAFRSSKTYQLLVEEAASFRRNELNTQRVRAFQEDVAGTRHKLSPRTQPEVSSFLQQILVAMKRHYQLVWGDLTSLAVILIMNLVNALIFGSAFYKPALTATGAFQLSGALFLSLIYFTLNALGETASTVHSRVILHKQHRLGMLHPAVASIALNLAELPIVFLQTILFTVPFYFLLGLNPSAAGFWFFELIVFVFYVTVLAAFRMLGAWAPNAPVAFLLAGCAMPVILAYSGYAPPWPLQLGWGSWIHRISPSPFALEALVGFEMGGVTLHCTEGQLVPSGPGYENVSIVNQGCPISGSTIGSSSVSGQRYLLSHFDYKSTHAWRNFGIILCFWLGYSIITAIGLTIMTERSGGGAAGGRIYKRGAVIPVDAAQDGEGAGDGDWQDLEAQRGRIEISAGGSINQDSGHSTEVTMTSRASEENKVNEKSRPSFTFKDVCYRVNVDGETKQLLTSVSGYVKPGQLTALMGVSGAGKTTLLDVLAQRKDKGTVSGEICVGSYHVGEMGTKFSNACGFCMQQDVHDSGTTVREALLFSASMRRPLSVPHSEKEAHVDEVINLLKLESIADAMIGVPGEGGLGVEERKRVTIGVELAANPTMLLFLDEPTSGLDSQAAFSLVQFLKRIAASGVPIICTIHQPSAVIFEMFDHVLLLAPGGRTIYFGETGPNSGVVTDYFARNGTVMDSSENPAEFILNSVANPSGAAKWTKTWNESLEARELQAQIDHINATDSQASPSNENRQIPFLYQYICLTQRHFRSMWRNGFYTFSRICKAIFMSLFLSFTFFHSNRTEQGLQDRVLVMLLWQWAIPAAAQDLQTVWFSKWALYMTRERSGVGYHPLALCAALVSVELPLAIVVYTIFFLCGWWTVGLPHAGFGYLLFLGLGVFGIGFPYAVASLFGNERDTGYANSLFWIILATFSGTVIPHSAMNGFYKPWMYWADPLRYWSSAAASAALRDLPVECSAQELTYLNPPPGMNCGGYFETYLSSADEGSTSGGYLTNPNATSNCAYCPYSLGDDYAVSLGYIFDERWRDWGIFTTFCISTLAIAFIVMWLKFMRLPSWLKLKRSTK